MSGAEATIKIAFVDVEKVLEGYRKWQDYSEALEAIEQEIKNEKEQVEANIQDKLRALELLVKQEEKETRFREIKQYEAVQSERLKAKYEDAKSMQKKFRGEITGDLRGAIKQIGKKGDYDAVFTSEVCFYAKYDVTDEVIKELNKGYNKKKVEGEKSEKDGSKTGMD